MGGFDIILGAFGAVLTAVQSYPGFEIATLVLGGVFVWSGAAKLLSPRRTVQAIADFQLLRSPDRRHALVLAGSEVGVGVALVLGDQLTFVFGVASVMLGVFSFAVARALRRGASFSCFCFGAEAELSYRTLLRNLLLLGLVTVLLTAGTDAVRLSVPVGDALGILAVTVSTLAGLLVAAQIPSLLRWNSEVRDHHRKRARECAVSV